MNTEGHTADPSAREARMSDLDVVSALAERFYREEGFITDATRLRANMRELIQASSAHVQLVWLNGSAAGFAVTTTTLGLEHHLVAELQDLYVLPGFRRGGVAAALISGAAEWARAYGCEALDVVVDAEGDARHQLTRFYRRRGFLDDRRHLLTRPLTNRVPASPGSDGG